MRSFWIRFNTVGHLYNCSMPSVLLVNEVTPPPTVIPRVQDCQEPLPALCFALQMALE